MSATLTLTLTPSQIVAVQRFRVALAGDVPDVAAELTDEEAARVLFSTACAAWMDADPIEAAESEGT